MFKRKSKSDKAPKVKKENKPKKPREKRTKAPVGAALKKQPMDVYTAMLMVSLAALLIGIFLLGAQLAMYTDQGFFKGYPWWKAG